MSSNVSILHVTFGPVIRSVLGEAGYNAKLLVDDPRSFETAELLVTKLFLAGEDSRPGLAAKLECQLGKAGRYRRPPGSSLARYAIQGLPSELQFS
ncbi:hypothetical protein Q1M64_07630 (plasmid) [Sinorhizobium meliloti]|nr:hypothetical protein LZK74_08300 [Sinorhizobium meliloti]WKL24166.1 hypothetical protein Q1M63_09030 [Sinorhizobium meliloti]WKL28098.1 hypothetical protein Q1M65_07315 [Sinorhizobium meliloti]WKL33664.1 hypothetical protein Q1M62_06965 [Sinorhizobium meliloti]WKL39273.1 hypothetical protein Q1M64_07630 [Sinorhizobium meliloti]